ncbi:MAG: Uma2 family endonuclease [Bryobacterales bacterium]|nr:Uma2 family endonuclease [Bryobacterales bacterium]
MMQYVLNEVPPDAPIRIGSGHDLSDEEIHAFCLANPDLRIEVTAEGDIEIMPPTYASTGYENNEVARQLANWAIRDGKGYVFDSSTGFRLPSGALRSPDVSWVSRSRLAAFTSEEKKSRFLPLCPDFVIELRSESDKPSRLQSKMNEWTAAGAQLGWLIDPTRQEIHIYRPGRQPNILRKPATLSGEAPIDGFTLDLAPVWRGLQP